jgi:hypothetical protein
MGVMVNAHGPDKILYLTRITTLVKVQQQHHVNTNEPRDFTKGL